MPDCTGGCSRLVSNLVVVVVGGNGRAASSGGRGQAASSGGRGRAAGAGDEQDNIGGLPSGCGVRAAASGVSPDPDPEIEVGAR